MATDMSVTFTLYIDILINEETTAIYSEDEEATMDAMNRVVRSAEKIIEKEGFISLERFLRLMKVRASMSCPNIYFMGIGECEYGSGLLTVEFLGGYDLEPIFPPKRTEKKPKPELKIVKNDKESGEEEWPSNHTETSESEESGQT